MRPAELAAIEEVRSAERPPARRDRRRDVKPGNVRPRNLRAEVEQAFRDAGARVWREGATR